MEGWRPLLRGLRVVFAAVVLAGVSTVAAIQGLGGGDAEPASPTGDRDIYYVIPDRYAGPDTLKQQYGFDNSRFLEGLRHRGFVVTSGTRGNYPKTAHSLAASLNMRYLDFLVREHPEPDDWGPVFRLLYGARVARFLQARGYQYVYMGSWWDPTGRDPEADVNVTFDAPDDLTEDQLRRATLEQFEAIPRAGARPGAQLVIAHVLLPHPPYVFDRHGGPLTPEEREGQERGPLYLEQLRFTNVLLGRLVDRLLAGPEASDPIVILQSDEGPHPLRYEVNPLFDWTHATTAELREKFRLLNAYYLPGSDVRPPPRISPVNSFRLVLSEYFGADLPPLPDRSYVFRDEQHLYRFYEVTERVRG